MNRTYNIISEVRRQERMGLYVHVPFCHARCAYCDFYSQTHCTKEAQDRYVAALARSIDALAPACPPISTVYFGGGTPSALGLRLPPLISHVGRSLPVEPRAEITVEVNPESFDERLLCVLVEAGVNRISMGVQALDDDVLKSLGRLHTASDARSAMRLLQESGLNYSVDLIAGVPDTTREDMSAWVHEVASFKPQHLSIYPLTVEPRSALAQRPSFIPLDEDDAADYLESAWADAQAAGYYHYEVSNFAHVGFESAHNSAYWSGTPYLGIGPSASSALSLATGERLRFTQTDDFDDFCALPADVERELAGADCETLSLNEVARENLMLAMRMSLGAAHSDVQAAGLGEVFLSLVRTGLCRFDAVSRHFVPTKKGWMLGNEMFGAIWCAEPFVE